jgi:quercetin dioxygenase-like cupin family protein
MSNEHELIKQFEAEGYNPVYVWSAEPNEEDPDHDHDFDTKLHVLSGSIQIKILDGSRIGEYDLVAGTSFEIPRKQKHSGLAGTEGCRYVVAEKH